MLLGILFICLGMRGLDRLNQQQRQISAGWLLVLVLILTAAFAVLYPISQKPSLNRGSDREDALRIELNAVYHHQYPYGTHTFLGNPPTPLPGAMLLAHPSSRWGTLLGKTSFGLPSFLSSRFASSAIVQPPSSS